MAARMIAMVGAICLLIGGLIGTWGAEKVQAQPSRIRFDVQHEPGFMFIRKTDTSDCFLAVTGGGIIPVRCS